MRPDVDDNVVCREASGQPILVDQDDNVENRPIQRAVAKPPSFSHEAPCNACFRSSAILQRDDVTRCR
jgi:hypothetical protein